MANLPRTSTTGFATLIFGAIFISQIYCGGLQENEIVHEIFI